MKNYLKDFDSWEELVEYLEQAGLTNKKKYPQIYRAWLAAKLRKNYKPLMKLFKKRPDIPAYSKRRATEMPFKPPVNEEAEKLSLGQIVLGTIRLVFSILKMAIVQFNQHMLIIGRAGSGKSTLIGSIISQILSIPQDKRDCRLLIFDTKGDFFHLIKKHPHLKVLTKETCYFNPFEVQGGSSEGYIEAGMKRNTAIFCDVLYFGATGRPIIEGTLRKEFIRKGIYHGKDSWPKISEVMERIKKETEKYKSLKIGDVKAAIHFRFQELKDSVSFNQTKGIPLDYFQNNDVVIDSRGFSKAELGIVSMMLTARLLHYNLHNNIRGNILKNLVVIDEGHKIFDVERERSYNIMPAEEIANLVRESREFGIGLIVASQSFADIPRYLKNNCSTIACLKTQDQNIEDAKEAMGLDDEQADYIYKLGSSFEGIARVPHCNRPLLLTTDRFFYDKNVTQDDTKTHMAADIQMIKAWIKPRLFNIPHNAEKILRILVADPFITKTELKKRLNLDEN